MTLPKGLRLFYDALLSEGDRLELESWLRWNDPNGVWDPLDPDYVELPKSELVSIVRRMISGE